MYHDAPYNLYIGSPYSLKPVPGGIMPPRRSHKKSKAGCQRCKNRKIKVSRAASPRVFLILTMPQCDEIHPTCGNCSKHGVPCDFEGPLSPAVVTPMLSREDSHSHASIASTPRSNSSIMQFYQMPTDIIRTNISPATTRSLELKLMHHL